MQKNLKWKLVLVLALMIVCAYYFIGPKEKGAPLMSRLNLGLDLRGGIHLVLKVVTDDALNQELRQDSERIAQELRSKSIAFVGSKKGNGFSIEVTGVDSAKASELRKYLDSSFGRKYSVRSSALEGTTNFSLTLTPAYTRETKESTVRQALETIRRRVDALGVTEPTLAVLLTL
jgi:preprotein translocase subunit SecD